jgi:hypothetical protein
MTEIVAELEGDEPTGRAWMKILLPRILRAVVWGLLMGGEFLLVSYMPEVGGELYKYIPIEPMAFSHFLILFIVFEVAIQLLRGTIFPYALRTARAVISMILLVVITNGGVMSMTLQPTPETPLPAGMGITISVDFQAVLGVFLLLSLLSIVKNVLHAVDFMAEAEETGFPPELP